MWLNCWSCTANVKKYGNSNMGVFFFITVILFPQHFVQPTPQKKKEKIHNITYGTNLIFCYIELVRIFLFFYRCLHFFSFSGGRSFGCSENSGAAGTFFENVPRSLVVSNHNMSTQTDTLLLEFPNQPLWTNVYVRNHAKVVVPLLWSRVQVSEQLALTWNMLLKILKHLVGTILFELTMFFPSAWTKLSLSTAPMSWWAELIESISKWPSYLNWWKLI